MEGHATGETLDADGYRYIGASCLTQQNGRGPIAAGNLANPRVQDFALLTTGAVPCGSVVSATQDNTGGDIARGPSHVIPRLPAAASLRALIEVQSFPDLLRKFAIPMLREFASEISMESAQARRIAPRDAYETPAPRHSLRTAVSNAAKR